MPNGGFDPFFGLFGSNVNVPGAPPDRSMYDEGADTLQSYLDLWSLYNAVQQAYGPSSAANQANTLESYLLGSPGGTQQVQYNYRTWVDPVYSGGGGGNNFLMEGLSMGDPIFGGLFGKKKRKRELVTPGHWQDATGTRTVAAAGTRGIGSILDELARNSQLAQRQADLEDISTLGPSMVDALLNADPRTRDLYDELNSQVLGDLEYGGQLTPEQNYRLRQQTRSAQAVRGLGYGPTDSAQEAMNLWLGGEDLRRQRQSAAMRTLALNKQITGDPFMMITGRPSQAFGAASGYGNQQAGQQGFWQDPYSGYASDLYNTNYNAAWSDRFAAQNYNAAMNAARMQLMGDIIGAGTSFAGLCWVAREVYGPDNPKWLRFRDWLLTKAPAAVVDWYSEYGPIIAGWVRQDPGLRPAIREIMDQKIEV